MIRDFGDVRSVVQGGGVLPGWWRHDERARRYVLDHGSPRVEWTVERTLDLIQVDEHEELDEVELCYVPVDERWIEHEEVPDFVVVHIGRARVPVSAYDVARVQQLVAADFLDAMIAARFVHGEFSRSVHLARAAIHARREWAQSCGGMQLDRLGDALNAFRDGPWFEVEMSFEQMYTMFACEALEESLWCPHASRAICDESIGLTWRVMYGAMLDHAERMIVRMVLVGEIGGEEVCGG